MSSWIRAAGTAGLVAALAAVVSAQSGDRPRVARETRAVEMLAGLGGSEIGVSVREVDASGGEAAKGTSQSGVLVEDVTADGPAAKAGLRKGDVVVEFDGERVRSVRQFTRLVRETPAGRRVPAAVTREGQRVAVTIEPRVADRIRLSGEVDPAIIMRDLGREFGTYFPPPPPPAAPPAPGAPPAPPVPRVPDVRNFIWRAEGALGVSVSPLSDQLATYFGVKAGVLVAEVREGSAAAAAGFKAGDVVTAFNGSEVSDPGDLRQRTSRLEDGAEFTAAVVRDRKPLTLKGKVQRRTSARERTRV